jgi:hypothetical protein
VVSNREKSGVKARLEADSKPIEESISSMDLEEKENEVKRLNEL